jgi:catechol 2,3-dioxygenase-like lactoylglutathione lyase family enzyme
MQPRLDLLTLAVDDLDAARRFYLDGLGWPAALDVPGEVLFLQLNHGLLVGLFGSRDLADDMEADRASVLPGAGFTLAHIVGSPADVRDVVARAQQAGATVVKPPQDAAFGGYHAYFADPVGLRWEVAWNPGWRVLPDGTVQIGLVQPTDPDQPAVSLGDD